MANLRDASKYHRTINSNRMYKFVISSPKESTDPETLAEYLIHIDAVAEVDVSDSDDDKGLLIKTRFLPGRAPLNVYSYMSNRISRKYGRIENANTR
ncbi:MAG: hypothetical protein ACP5MZ_02305 [Candidatus Micrarchaeia archaeon]